MLSRLLAHWHPGGDDRMDDGFDWGSEELLPSPSPSRRAPRTSFWDEPVGGGTPSSRAAIDVQAPAAVERETDENPVAEAETAVVFYRVDEGETLPGIARRFGIKPSRIVADNRLDAVAKLQKGMLLKLHVPRGSLSRLASERPLDDSQYAPRVQLDTGSGPDDETTIATPTPAPAPSQEVRTPRDEIDPWATPSKAAPITPRKRHNGARSSGRRSMADFAELFARKP
jgi:LysM repeat protein